MELTSLKLGMNEEGIVNWRDPYTHLTCLGKSGTGKSSLMLSMIRQESFYPTAKVIIDPSGFLARDAWSISKGKALYCSVKHPVSINPLMLPYDEDVISDLTAESINQVIERTTANQALTVKMREILDDATKWCLARSRKSLIHVRDYIAAQKGDATARDGLLARLNFLLSNKTMEEILCANNSVSWPKLIAQGKTFILDCHGMSEEKMIFVGCLIVNQLKAHFRFGDTKDYKPLRVYIDECHNFLSLNVLGILKEARKFKFSFVMMTVDFSDIAPKLVHALTNVGTLVCFRLGFREAQMFAREFDCSSQELMLLEKHQLAYLTPREKGICQAPRPPYVRKLELKTVAPQRKAKWGGWFPLEPLKPAGAG